MDFPSLGQQTGSRPYGNAFASALAVAAVLQVLGNVVSDKHESSAASTGRGSVAHNHPPKSRVSISSRDTQRRSGKDYKRRDY